MTVITIDEPLRTYLTDPAVEAAVNLLMKSSSDKRVGIEADADYFNHSEYAQAWLAAREVYVAWYQTLWSVWDACWQGMQDASLTRLSTAEVEAQEWEVPSFSTARNQEWIGAIFWTRSKNLIAVYVKATFGPLAVGQLCVDAKRRAAIRLANPDRTKKPVAKFRQPCAAR